MEFGSFEELKRFMESIFIRSPRFGFPSNPSLKRPLLNEMEEWMVINIYNDSYRGSGGEIVKQITGHFLHLLQLIVPSQNFINIFKHLIYLEWMEHAVKPEPRTKGKKFYRDHILHCANVCWVGHKLIFDLENPFYGHLKTCLEEILPSRCKELLKTENDWTDFIRVTWYITAMVHDFGYPIELIERNYTGEDLYLCSKNYLKPNRLTNYFKDHLKGTIPLFKDQLQTIDKKIFNDPSWNCDSIHPIIGCLEILHFLKKNYKRLIDKKSIYRYIYQLAALGILEHHNEKKIDFDLNPFGYLLVLADSLHEWHRYVLTGASGSRLKFVSPITRMAIKKEGTKCYNLKFDINPAHTLCNGWDPGKFIKFKTKELKRLKPKPDLPEFILK